MTTIVRNSTDVAEIPQNQASPANPAEAPHSYSTLCKILTIAIAVIIVVILVCSISIPLLKKKKSKNNDNSDSSDDSTDDDVDIYEINKENIVVRMEKGMKILKENTYSIKETEIDPLFQSFSINGMKGTVSQYEIENFGNLVIMKVVDKGPMQMDTFAITPFNKDLPLLSTDVMYMGKSRIQLVEIYNTTATVEAQNIMKKYLPEFEKINEKMKDVQNYSAGDSWLNDVLLIHLSKMANNNYDEVFLNCFYEYLNVYIKMEKELKDLGNDDYQAHWKSVRNYSDTLVEAGGVSTNMFVSLWGKDKTKEFFNKVFFATDLYKK